MDLFYRHVLRRGLIEGGDRCPIGNQWIHRWVLGGMDNEKRRVLPSFFEILDSIVIKRFISQLDFMGAMVRHDFMELVDARFSRM